MSWRLSALGALDVSQRLSGITLPEKANPAHEGKALHSVWQATFVRHAAQMVRCGPFTRPGPLCT